MDKNNNSVQEIELHRLILEELRESLAETILNGSNNDIKNR